MEKVKKKKVKRVSAVKLRRRQRRCLWRSSGAFGGAASLRKCICTFNAGHAHTEYWCMCSLGFTWKHRAINRNVTETEAFNIFLNGNERNRRPQKNF